MQSLTVLITGVGAPEIVGTIHSLRHNFDHRQMNIIGADTHAGAVGQHMCDGFFTIPETKSQDAYLMALKELCLAQRVDVILPQTPAEVLLLSSHSPLFSALGSRVAISDARAVKLASCKSDFLHLGEHCGIPTPQYFLVENGAGLRERATELGWPRRPVVVKPTMSNSLFGVRVVDEVKAYRNRFYGDQPAMNYTTLGDLCGLLADVFPPLMVMEYLPGDEYHVDVLRTVEGVWAVPRVRRAGGPGLSGDIETINHEALIRHSKRLADAAGLLYCFGFKFKENEQGVPKLLGCSPNVDGTMVLATIADANLIYAAVKAACGEETPDFRPRWQTRLLHYWGGVGVTPFGENVYL